MPHRPDLVIDRKFEGGVSHDLILEIVRTLPFVPDEVNLELMFYGQCFPYDESELPKYLEWCEGNHVTPFSTLEEEESPNLDLREKRYILANDFEFPGMQELFSAGVRKEGKVHQIIYAGDYGRFIEKGLDIYLKGGYQLVQGELASGNDPYNLRVGFDLRDEGDLGEFTVEARKRLGKGQLEKIESWYRELNKRVDLL